MRKKGARPDLSRAVASGRRPLSWFPLMILFALAGSGMAMAIEALQAGEVAAALGAFVPVAFAAFIGWRRLRRRS